jgi:hypothetical protein
LAPTSSVHALDPTGELTVIVVGSDFACGDAAAPEVSWAAVSAAAAAVAAGAGVIAAADPAVGLEVAAVLFESFPRLWPSRLSSALPLPPPLPAPMPMRLSCDEPPLADVAVAAGVETVAAAPAHTPLSAFASSARAVDTGSAPECLADESLSSSVPDLPLPLAVAPLVGAVPSVGAAVGVAARDWASVVEKSSALVAVCAVVLAEEA